MATKRQSSKVRKAKRTGRAAKKDQHAKGTLVLMLKDGRGLPITARTAILLRETLTGSHEFRANGKAGEVSRFTFELLPGAYTVQVHAEGFKPYSQSVRLVDEKESVYEFALALGDPDERGRKGEDDAELLKGRFT